MERNKETGVRIVYENPGFRFYVEEHAPADGHCVHNVVRKPGAVVILPYDPVKDAVAFVKQERLPFKNDPKIHGIIMEVIAGHIELGELPGDTALKEIWEEMGARIRPDQAYFLNNGAGVAVSPGWTDECAMLAFARLEPGQCDETRTEFGAAEEGERTKLEWIPVCELGNMIFQDLKTFALVQWFLRMRREGDARCRP